VSVYGTINLNCSTSSYSGRFPRLLILPLAIGLDFLWDHVTVWCFSLKNFSEKQENTILMVKRSPMFYSFPVRGKVQPGSGSRQKSHEDAIPWGAPSSTMGQRLLGARGWRNGARGVGISKRVGPCLPVSAGAKQASASSCSYAGMLHPGQHLWAMPVPRCPGSVCVLGAGTCSTPGSVQGGGALQSPPFPS